MHFKARGFSPVNSSPKMSKRTLPLLLLTLLALFAAPRLAYAQQLPPITVITVEHAGCLGTCPVYKVILRRSGTATFIGTNYVTKLGTYASSVSGFDHLARAIQARNFSKFKPVYTRDVTDNPGVETGVGTKTRRIIVVNYADTGPQALWEIQAMIDGVATELQWKKVSDKRHDP